MIFVFIIDKNNNGALFYLFLVGKIISIHWESIAWVMNQNPGEWLLHGAAVILERKGETQRRDAKCCFNIFFLSKHNVHERKFIRTQINIKKEIWGYFYGK